MFFISYSVIFPQFSLFNLVSFLIIHYYNGVITFFFQFDLRRAFVRYCVRNGINRLKRFHSGKVYGYTDELGFLSSFLKLS